MVWNENTEDWMMTTGLNMDFELEHWNRILNWIKELFALESGEDTG